MSIQIEKIRTSELVPYARNARTHTDEQVDQIVASIREFGFTNPVLIDEENMIIAGHGRVMAAERMGLERIPCIRLTGLTEAQKRAYVIADNKLALNAGWDEQLLYEELLALADDGFDMELTGFGADWEQQFEQQTKEDVRFLENFDVSPPPRPVWILVSAKETSATEIIRAIEAAKDQGDRIEVSGL